MVMEEAVPSPKLDHHLVSTLLETMKFTLLLLALSLELLLMFLGKWELLISIFFFLTIILATFRHSSPPIIYLVDFSCLKPPNLCRVPFSKFLEHCHMFGTFDQESLDFMSKILSSSGQSEETYLPPSLHYIPPKTEYDEFIKEVHMAFFPVVDDLLERTKVSPQDVDVLIVNCSGFCPSPSLASIIIQKYSMRSDIKSYNISGMGCSASALALDMAKNLLTVHKNCNALILSTEILSTGWYSGREKTKLLLNCLFRMGSAAVLLTNRPRFKKSAKYRLSSTFRTQRAFEDRAYASAIREEDGEGKLGVTLKRDLLMVAGETLRSNITVIGSRILPFSEKFRHGFSIVWKRFVDKSAEVYVPNFKSVVHHFCLPTSGRPVIREIAKGLKLGEADMEAALMTLHRFGNQSSSSLWYELAYMEAKERIKKGDRVWQLGMGSGPKCISVILDCVRPISGEAVRGPWVGSIHQYPIATDPSS